MSSSDDKPVEDSIGENVPAPELNSDEDALKHALLSKVQQFGAGQSQQLEAEVEELVRRLIK